MTSRQGPDSTAYLDKRDNDSICTAPMHNTVVFENNTVRACLHHNRTPALYLDTYRLVPGDVCTLAQIGELKLICQVEGGERSAEVKH